MSRVDPDSLFCSGCAHSAAGEPFPGRPSGERPCCFCVRNPTWRQQQASPHAVTKWYDQSDPIRIPMDCYHSLDFTEQVQVWIRAAEQRDSSALTTLIAAHNRLTEGDVDGRP